MPQLSISNLFTVTLNPAEFNLIARALGGRLRNEAEVAEAAALGDALAVLRAKDGLARTAENEKLVENLRAAGHL